jgi:hypothetical protein
MKNQHFTITCPPAYYYDTSPDMGKVAVIKTIRLLSGCGLKEAKDISEITSTQTIGLIGALSEDAVMEKFKILERNGCKVTSSAWTILDKLQALAADATDLGEHELAEEILQLVTAEKLRHQPFFR